METKKMLNFGRTILGIINATNEALLEHALFYFLSIYRRMKARLLRPKKKGQRDTITYMEKELDEEGTQNHP
jgi:hypothetical protein